MRACCACADPCLLVKCALYVQAEWRALGHAALPLNNKQQEVAWKEIFQANLDGCNEMWEEGSQVGRIVFRRREAS